MAVTLFSIATPLGNPLSAKQGFRQHGLNVAASRLTSLEIMRYTRCVEAASVDFSQVCAALLVGNVINNLIAAQALRDDASHVLIDARAHASLRDATRFFSCPVIDFKHPRYKPNLARHLRGKSRPLVLTGWSVSHDGQIAPLREYLRILPAIEICLSMTLIRSVAFLASTAEARRNTLEFPAGKLSRR